MTDHKLLRTFVVANPRAGAGQVEREWAHIERLLRAQLPELDYAFTEGPNHATLLAREALKNGWEMVVAIGGDGTINEVTNGFFEKVDAAEEFEREDGHFVPTASAGVEPINPDAVLGILPMGTGGDFRRTAGIMGTLSENVERLGGPDTRPCDVGQLVYVDHDGKPANRFFINIASAGFSGEVDKAVNNMWKGLGGGLSFRIASSVAWLAWKNRPLEVVVDDEAPVRRDYFMVTVCNGKYFGGGMHVAPDAELDDGKFEVVFLEDLSKWGSATLMKHIYQGEHLSMSEVSRREARTVSVRALESAPVLLDVDGEQPGRLPALFIAHENALRLKV